MLVVGIRISNSARTLICAAGETALEVGDGCLVATDRGTEFGVVTHPLLDSPRHRNGDLPRVVRRATVEDEEAYAEKEALENEGWAFCRERIEQRSLPMKLGRVERQLDGKKMIFHFTAEGRVDFRELVRDLSARFRTRVELHQMGVRDDAAILGGCGPCGRTLCCAGFLKGFEPVSIKMAKAQGMSLNPAKVSGMCGRLMCCLKFEHETEQPPSRKPNAAGNGCTCPARAASPAG
jgi:cell fate regulator YaaT (PSP1 superfamily)